MRPLSQMDTIEWKGGSRPESTYWTGNWVGVATGVCRRLHCKPRQPIRAVTVRTDGSSGNAIPDYGALRVGYRTGDRQLAIVGREPDDQTHYLGRSTRGGDAVRQRAPRRREPHRRHDGRLRAQRRRRVHHVPQRAERPDARDRQHRGLTLSLWESVPENRARTNHAVDAVFDLRTQIAGTELENHLTIPKFRHGNQPTDTIKLELTEEVAIDTSRDIA